MYLIKTHILTNTLFLLIKSMYKIFYSKNNFLNDLVLIREGCFTNNTYKTNFYQSKNEGR